MNARFAATLAATAIALAAAAIFSIFYEHADPVALPELMTAADGRKITSAAEWEQFRRPEILSFAKRHIYGERPVERPADLAFSPIAEDRPMLNGMVVRKSRRATFSGPRGKWSFDFHAFIPAHATSSRPSPAFILICNRALEKFADVDLKNESGFFPVREIVSRGYAVAVFKNTDLALDDYHPHFAPDGTVVIQDPPFTNGFYACWAPCRTLHSWGAISAWAWGASRVLDWMETEPTIDSRRVAVVGHSRGGKTSLWAAASDPRFAMACVNDSGCCGAKLNHAAVAMSETIMQDNNNNPHWFARAFRKFNGRDQYLPYDQHFIAALIAPRLLCIASASQDSGAGPWGEYLTARHASPAWALYGKRGLVEDHPYLTDRPFNGGSVHYHLREGKHDLTLADWKYYLDFADLNGWRQPCPNSP